MRDRFVGHDGFVGLSRFLKRTLAAAALAGLMLPGSVSAQEAGAQATETVKETHGAWEVVCIANSDPEQCRLRQIGKTADGKTALVVYIGKLDGVKTQAGENVPAAIRITTPLGTILRKGLKVRIDSGEPQTAMYEVCLPNGCIVSDAISDKYLAQLKAGANAKMSFDVLQQEETLNVTISLKGFTRAFKAL
jgi:invasion protein IalB